MVATLAGLLAGAGSLALPARPAAAEPMPATITILGRGAGHGDGLSQWGAYGYATTKGWDWHRILAHYYGGTTEATVDPATPIAVRLLALDNQASTAVVNARGLLAVTADGNAGRWGTVLAVKTGATTYAVYGRASATCPSPAAVAGVAAPGSGWTPLGTMVSSTATGAGAGRVEITVPGVDPATADRPALAAVCRPDGSVRSYRGSIVVLSGTEGEARTVNKLAIDQYLRGVVPRESPASWGSSAGGAGMHALRSQAVAARTYALAEKRYSYAQTCDSDSCQVYGGAATRTDPAAATVTSMEDARTDTAVADTAGVVLRTGDGKLAYTQFNASSGGITSGANFPSVVDDGDAVTGNPHHRWSVTRTRAQIEAAFPTVGTLTGLTVSNRNGVGEWGGRAGKVTVQGTTTSTTVSAWTFASKLGLLSTWISIGGAGDAPTPEEPSTSGPLVFNQVAPTRIVDTREGLGADRAPVAAGKTLTIEPARLAGLDGAKAVSVNLTVTNPAAAGYATAYPCARGLPLASTVNFRAGQTVANQTTTPLDASGRLCVYVHSRTDLVVDVVGWLGEPGNAAAGSLFTAVGPTRLADTRSGTGGTTGPLAAGQVVPLDVHAVLGEVDATAVVLNVTSTEVRAGGFVTAYACGTDRPLASHLNPVAGRTIASHVIAPVAADGRVCLFTSQPTQLVVDVLGWYGGAPPAAAAFESLTPTRLLDTRTAGGPLVGRAAARRLPVAGVGDVPAAGVTAVVVNLTATGSAGEGFVTAYPCDSPMPTASNLNVAAGIDVANTTTVAVGPSGAVCLYANVTTDLVVDITGVYAA